MTAKAKKKKSRSAPASRKAAGAKAKPAARKAAKPRSAGGSEESHYSDLRRLAGSYAARKLV